MNRTSLNKASETSIPYEIILASGSPRRREIMNLIGTKYRVVPSTKEEVFENIAPDELVKKLSSMKSNDVAERVSSPAVIIGADTIVAYKGKLLGKPKNREDAFNMIKSFSGDSHYVHTGVSIIIKKDSLDIKELSFEVSTRVTVSEMTDEQINTYIASGEPMDKAGAYAIQGLFAPYITGIEGDYYNIVGFPICAIYHALVNEGIELIPQKQG